MLWHEEKNNKKTAKQNDTKEEATDEVWKKKIPVQNKTEMHFQPQGFPTFTGASRTSDGTAGFFILIYITYRRSDRW